MRDLLNNNGKLVTLMGSLFAEAHIELHPALGDHVIKLLGGALVGLHRVVEAKIRQLILDGVREIVANYDVDGIHFDDYFYPTQEESLDAEAYQLHVDSDSKLIRFP